MPRRRDDLIAGETYHVYNRGVDRRLIFLADENWAFFLRRVRDYLLPTHAVLAYCLMPNHYHLVVRIGDTGFPDSMQRLGTSYTKAVNRQETRSGPLFQSRYQTRHVDTEDYLLHLTRYVHRNPVEAGLVRRPEKWAFSSYRDYIGLRTGTLPLCDPVLNAFSGESDYARFVDEVGSGWPDGFDEVLFDDELVD